MIKFTQSDYIEGRCSHRDYYAQFVNNHTRALVALVVGKERILSSTDEHFNDIPLRVWDRCHPVFNTCLSDSVCAAKEAARQIKEEAE